MPPSPEGAGRASVLPVVASLKLSHSDSSCPSGDASPNLSILRGLKHFQATPDKVAYNFYEARVESGAGEL